MTYTFLEHPADIKFQVRGTTKARLFEASARAFSAYVRGDVKLEKKKKMNISIKASDEIALLYKFLDELIYLADAKDFVVVEANVKVTSTRLTAALRGDTPRGRSLNHVKAATYAEMYIKKKGKLWEGQVVLDV